MYIWYLKKKSCGGGVNESVGKHKRETTRERPGRVEI